MPASPATTTAWLAISRLALRADHAGHEAEVGGEPVVEAVDHVPEEAAGAGLVPRLALRAAHRGQRLGVLLGLLGQLERGGADGAVRGDSGRG